MQYFYNINAHTLEKLKILNDNNEEFYILCNEDQFKILQKKCNFLHIDQITNPSASNYTYLKRYFYYDLISLPFFQWHNDDLLLDKAQIYISKQYIVLVLSNNLFTSSSNDFKLNKNYSISFIYYSLLDIILTNNFRSLEVFEKNIITTENLLLVDKTTKNALNQVIQLKNFSFEINQNLRLLTYIGYDILEDDNHFITNKSKKYFKNILSKMEQLKEFSLLLSSKTEHLMDIYNTTVNNKTNNVLNKLTILTAFSIPITVLSGIYGMNFANMPLLESRYGYYYIIILMLCSSLAVYLYINNSK